MDKKIKEKWLKELRDPATTQTTRVLVNNEGARCCLGVLCDIVGVARSDGTTDCSFDFSKYWDDDDYGSPVDYYDEELPTTIFGDIVGLSYKDMNSLAVLNDGSKLEDKDGLSFLQLADHIEKMH